MPAELPRQDGYPERLEALAAALRQDDITVDTIDLPFPVADFHPAGPCRLGLRLIGAPGTDRALADIAQWPHLRADRVR